MKKIKTFFLWALALSQIFALILLWGMLIYCAFTNTPIESMLAWHWWIFFFGLDVWTKNLDLKLPAKSE